MLCKKVGLMLLVCSVTSMYAMTPAIEHRDATGPKAPGRSKSWNVISSGPIGVNFALIQAEQAQTTQIDAAQQQKKQADETGVLQDQQKKVAEALATPPTKIVGNEALRKANRAAYDKILLYAAAQAPGKSGLILRGGTDRYQDGFDAALIEGAVDTIALGKLLCRHVTDDNLRAQAALVKRLPALHTGIPFDVVQPSVVSLHDRLLARLRDVQAHAKEIDTIAQTLNTLHRVSDQPWDDRFSANVIAFQRLAVPSNFSSYLDDASTVVDTTDAKDGESESAQ